MENNMASLCYNAARPCPDAAFHMYYLYRYYTEFGIVALWVTLLRIQPWKASVNRPAKAYNNFKLIV